MKEDKLKTYNKNITLGNSQKYTVKNIPSTYFLLAAVDRANLSDDDVWAHFMDCYNNVRVTFIISSLTKVLM
mgnify:CR=1 FL=1